MKNTTTELNYYSVLAGYKAMLCTVKDEGLELDDKHWELIQEFESYISENDFEVTDMIDNLDNYYDAIKKLMGKTKVEIPDNTYVSQLDGFLQDVIREELYNAIEADGIYTDDEVHENVQRGMDSKIVDLTDTIDVYAIIKRYRR